MPDNTSQIRYYAPAKDAAQALEMLLDAGGSGDGEVFAERRYDALRQLSLAILKHPQLRADGPSVALAYWLRTANLKQITHAASSRFAAMPNTLVRARGLVFHIAPSNIDTLFLYSWALAFLCGNASILRVSSEAGKVLPALLECFNAVLAEYDGFSKENIILTYPHDDALTARLSAACTHRVIWGGDETIRRIRAVPLNPHASERAFASKYSLALIHAERFLQATEAQQRAVVSAFRADVFAFDQMACSSPHQLAWLSPEEPPYAEAMARFEACLADAFNQQPEPSNDAAALRRLNFAFNMAASDAARFTPGTPGYTAMYLKHSQSGAATYCGGGLFGVYRITRLDDLARGIGLAGQTLTYWGFKPDELRQLAPALADCGLDRIVPFGQALDFDAVWDSYSLLDDFVSLVTLRWPT